MGNTISSAFGMVGGILGGNQQGNALDTAIESLATGLSNDATFRQHIQDWTTGYRDSLDEVKMRLAKGEPRPVAESQAYKDASMNLTRNLAAGGSIRSGAAVQGFRDLAGAEADRAFGQDAALYQMLGSTVGRGDQLTAALLGQEDRVRGGIAGLEVDKGAVEAAKTQGIFDSAGAIMGDGASAAFGGFGGGGAMATAGPLLNPGVDTARVGQGLQMGATAGYEDPQMSFGPDLNRVGRGLTLGG